MPAYEVQYLLACGQHDAQAVEDYLRGIGESVTLVRGDGCYRVHVHTDRPGPAIEVAVRAGTVSRIEVACLHQPADRPGADRDDHGHRA